MQPFAEADGVGVGGSRGLSMSTTVNDTGSILNSSSLAFSTPGTALAASVYLHTVATPGTTGEERVRGRVGTVGAAPTSNPVAAREHETS